MKPKIILKYVLLVFVIATLVAQIGKSFRETPQVALPQGLTVIVCHAQVRCPTCTTMERLSKQCLAKHFPNAGVQFVTLNYEAAENREIAEKYGIATATVLLVRLEKDEATVENLVTQAWQTVGDEPAFIEMLRKHLTAFLHGGSVEKFSESHEIEIPTDWDGEDVWE